MKILKANPKNAEEISKLRIDTLKELNINDYNEEQMNYLIKRNSPESTLNKIKEREVFVMVDKNEIIGTIDLGGNKIGGLFIKFDKIKQGIGTKLLNFIENYAKKKKIEKLRLYSTKSAINFYKKHGYNQTEDGKEIAEGIEMPKRIMEKELK